MKKIGKIKQKKWNVYSTYQWFDLIPIGGIAANVTDDKKFITQNTSVCIYLDEHYYGLDLFKANDIQQLGQWKYLLKIDGVFGLVLNINSIGDKYRMGLCRYQ